MAEDAKGAPAVIEPRPSTLSAISGAEAADSCCGTTGGDCGLSADLLRVDAPVDCVTLVVDDRFVSDWGRFGTDVDVVDEFEVLGVVADAGGESRYEGAGGGDDVIGRDIGGL